MRRLLDVLLTTESAQRTRLVQAAMVLVALSVAALALLVLAAAGVAPVRPVLLWALVVPVGMLAIFIAIRSGWSRRFEDPSLTMAQIIGGSAPSALADGFAGPFGSVQQMEVPTKTNYWWLLLLPLVLFVL